MPFVGSLAKGCLAGNVSSLWTGASRHSFIRKGEHCNLKRTCAFNHIETQLADLSPETTSRSLQLGSSPGTEPLGVYDPMLPDPTSTVVTFFFILCLSVAAAVIWSNDVVPMKRTELAISKSRGKVKEYLDELRVDGNKLNGGGSEFKEASKPVGNEAASARKSKGFERWLFSDWLRGDSYLRRKSSAVPFLRNAKWNSGDNPVLVASALILASVIAASFFERLMW